MSDWRCGLANPPRTRLSEGWRLWAAEPGRFAAPAELPTDSPWREVPTDGTVAAMLRAAGAWQLDAPVPQRFDAYDWWLCTEFTVPAEDVQGDDLWLHFDGLASCAEVWLNGEPLLSSDNMFVAHALPVTPQLRPGVNRLDVCCRSLDAALNARRPRPRWRAPMVEQQQLRWFRTTLLGRLPGWTPPVAAVGLWKPVFLERRAPLHVAEVSLQAHLDDTGIGQVRALLHLAGGEPGALSRVELQLERAGAVFATRLQSEGDAADPQGRVFAGALPVAEPALWWPHTHGEPALYAARLNVWAEGADAPRCFELGSLGFRRIELGTADGGFALRINGEAVFCRGACWMPLDVVSLASDRDAVRAAVQQARDAGMNMLRLTGTAVYEDQTFYDACDEFGVMVWQDLMFANMDYPADDVAFAASAHREVMQQAARWQARPCLAVVCGNSEGEQQAAMWGAPREQWQPEFFHRTLRGWVAERLPDVPYWPSSAHGGAFPHQPDQGTCSYYGVGAYLRPLDEARWAGPRFATECLAFANVPDEAAIARMPGGHALRVHHPGWKARAPRDLGAGWDFEDVRDHYLAELNAIDPMRLRYADHARYLDLSRVVTGEVMAHSFDQWRRPGSRCAGALVWLLRDLWAGAGWGLLDETGTPKACFYALRRSLQPVAVSLTDDGLNGVSLHLHNETPQALHGELELVVHGTAGHELARVRQAIELGPRHRETRSIAVLLDGFVDTSWAYRFGPAAVSLVHARLHGLGRRGIGDEAFFWPKGTPPQPLRDPGLSVQVLPSDGDDGIQLRLGAQAFAESVTVTSDTHLPDDNHFHLPPGGERVLTLRPRPGRGVAAGQVARGQVTALNAPAVIAWREEG